MGRLEWEAEGMVRRIESEEGEGVGLMEWRREAAEAGVMVASSDGAEEVAGGGAEVTLGDAGTAGQFEHGGGSLDLSRDTGGRRMGGVAPSTGA